jgi:hypothetical protein
MKKEARRVIFHVQFTIIAFAIALNVAKDGIISDLYEKVILYKD